MSFKSNENTKIGGYELPADFPYITNEFISSLIDLSFEERINKIYSFISKNSANSFSFEDIKNADFPSSIISVDIGLAVLELNDGKGLNYNDYLGNGDKLSEIYSLSSIIISAYVDLVGGGLIDLGEKINLAFNGFDGRLALSSWFCKLLKLPVDTLIIGSDKPVDKVIKNVFIQPHFKGEVDVLIKGVFEDLDYLLDPISAVGLVAYDYYYSDYEDNNLTVLLSLTSPYYFSRQILKAISGINEISIDKAMDKVNALTALEIPNQLTTKQIQPFFAVKSPLSLNEALDIIKGTLLV